MKVSVIGLGKLGSPLAALLADSGYFVIGVDANPDYVEKLNRGKAPVVEPGLDALILKNRTRLRATTKVCRAVEDSEVTFIIVPTPSDTTGRFVSTHVERVMEEIAETLQHLSRYHLVVVVSTLMPGETKRMQRDYFLDKRDPANYQPLNVGLCYSPEFIALGSVINDMRNPDMIVIGASNKRAGKELEKILLDVADSDPPVKHMGLKEAEITKIAINTYITNKISYANLISEICEQKHKTQQFVCENVNAHTVLDAIGADTRIGSKYLTPATPYGGPCFPRDTIAFTRFAEDHGVEAEIPTAVDRVNDRQVTRIVDHVLKASFDRYGVLGLAYKPFTSVTECSAGVKIANELASKNDYVMVYDPYVRFAPGIKPNVVSSPDMETLLQKCKVVVIATAWPEFDKINPLAYPDVQFLDCWNQLEDAPNVKKLGTVR